MKNTLDNNNSKYFLLFQDVKIIRGKESSMIYDLSRNDLFPIENKYLDFLEMCLGKTKEEILEIKQENILDFLNYFIEMDLAFFTNTPNSFPNISSSFEHPSKIISSVIELGAIEEHIIIDVINQLDDLGCKLLLLVVNDPAYDPNVLERILDQLVDSFVVHIELAIPYTFKDFLDVPFLAIHQRISKVVYLGADKYEHYEAITEAQIIHSTQDVFDPKEIIDPDNFSINTLSFMESNKFNVGLNRKLCVDKEGNILNYLGHAQKFGNVKTDQLSEVIMRDDFRSKWYISNDQIEKCKDCQYRFCCISNSDLISNGENYIKVEQCSFDVERNIWDG